MLVRTLVTLEALEGDVSVIVCDIDTVWHADPLKVVMIRSNMHNAVIEKDGEMGDKGKDGGVVYYHNHRHFHSFDVALTLDSQQEFCGCFIVLNNRYAGDMNGGDGKAAWRFWAEVTRQHVALLRESLGDIGVGSIEGDDEEGENDKVEETSVSKKNTLMPSFLESEQKIVTRLLSLQWNPAYFLADSHGATQVRLDGDLGGIPDLPSVAKMRNRIRQRLEGGGGDGDGDGDSDGDGDGGGDDDDGDDDGDGGSGVRGGSVLQFARLRVRVLPRSAFPSGYDYFNTKADHTSKGTKGNHGNDNDASGSDRNAVIIHNNHIIGIAAKESRFKRQGLWSLDFDADDYNSHHADGDDSDDDSKDGGEGSRDGGNVYTRVLGALPSRQSISTLNIISPIHRSVYHASPLRRRNTNRSSASNVINVTHLLSMERPEYIPSVSLFPSEVHTWLHTPYPGHFRSLSFSLLQIPLISNYVAPDIVYSSGDRDSKEGKEWKDGVDNKRILLEVQPFTSILHNTNLVASIKVLHLFPEGDALGGHHGSDHSASARHSTLHTYWLASLEYVLYNQRRHAEDWGVYYTHNPHRHGREQDKDDNNSGDDDDDDNINGGGGDDKEEEEEEEEEEAFTYRVIVLAYDRPASLQRLLRSLLLADYSSAGAGGPTARLGREICLDIYVDAAPISDDDGNDDGAGQGQDSVSGANDTNKERERERERVWNVERSIAIARKLNWPYGKKRVTTRVGNKGLAHQWLHCWKPASSRYASITPSLYHSITLLLYYSITLSLHHSITLLLHHPITLSLYYSITPSLYYSITLLP